MAIKTGTASNPFQLMTAIQEFMDDNGWNSLHDPMPASFRGPHTARYWRFTISSSDQQYASSYILGGVQLRDTIGGPQLMTDPARLSTSGTASTSSPLSNLILTSASQHSSITPPIGGNKQAVTIDYDFGTPTTIREAIITIPNTSTGFAPRRWSVQFSHDGIRWFTAGVGSYISTIVASANHSLILDETVLDSWHHSETETRFGMDNTYTGPDGPGIAVGESDTATSVYPGVTNSLFVFQGLGYGAGRPVYLYMLPVDKKTLRGSFIRMSASGYYDVRPGIPLNQTHATVGIPTPVFTVPDGEFTYWMYLNGHRLIIVTRDSENSYNSLYLGFMSAYLNPETYPDPSVGLGTLSTDGVQDIFSNIGYISKAGHDTGFIRDPAGIAVRIRNRDPDLATRGRHHGNGGRAFAWPDHFGSTRDTADNTLQGFYPGTGATFGIGVAASLANRIVVSAQGEVPAFPVQIISREFGALGALTGVALIPGRGIVPEQVITRGGENWRVFPCGPNRDPEDWFIVKEV